MHSLHAARKAAKQDRVKLNAKEQAREAATAILRAQIDEELLAKDDEELFARRSAEVDF